MVIFKTRYRANKISIHAPAKGATIMGFKRAIDSPYFNPRSREGSDCSPPFGTLPHCYFNPRSREGSDKGQTFSACPFLYFNPRSREGSDGKGTQHIHKSFKISIHAPAKGATCAFCCSSSTNAISIHAPAKGATAFINIFSLTVRLFLFHLTNKI